MDKTYATTLITVCFLLSTGVMTGSVAGANEATSMASVSSDQTASPLQTTNETVFKRVESNGSAFVVNLNLSLFTSMFQPGSALRVVTGGSVDGTRVVWFDIGIARDSSGFETRAEMTMQMPGFSASQTVSE